MQKAYEVFVIRIIFASLAIIANFCFLDTVTPPLNHILSRILGSITWAISLFIGLNTRLIRSSISKEPYQLRNRAPSWLNGFWFSFLIQLVVSNILGFQFENFLFCFSFSITLAYIGAKYGCRKLGCCNLKVLPNYIFQNFPFNPWLQTFELTASFMLLLAGLVLFSFGFTSFSVAILLVGHGILRIYSSKLRNNKFNLLDTLMNIRNSGIVCLGVIGLFVK